MVARISESIPAAALTTPSSEARTDTLRVLRAEEHAQLDRSQSALLLFELTRLHESRDDLASAARDALSATKADGTFIEPLEALIGIAVRSRSKGNLVKLLGRLAKLARNDNEKLQAALSLAQTQLANGELSAAEQLVEETLRELPESAPLWLVLEEIASRKQDAQLLLRASIGRSAHARSAELRSLLLERVARLQFHQNDEEAAFASLAQGFDEVPTWRALRAWEALSVVHRNYEQAREAATKTAALISATLDEPEEAELYQIPAPELKPARVLAAHLRCIIYSALQQRWDTAEKLASRLVELAPQNHLVQLIHGELGHRSGKTELLAAAYRNLLGDRLVGSPEEVHAPSASGPFAQSPLSSEETIYAASYLSLAARTNADSVLEQQAKQTLARVEGSSWIKTILHWIDSDENQQDNASEDNDEKPAVGKQEAFTSLAAILKAQLKADRSGWFDKLSRPGQESHAPDSALVELEIAETTAQLLAQNTLGPGAISPTKLEEIEVALLHCHERAAGLTETVTVLPKETYDSYRYLRARLAQDRAAETTLIRARLAAVGEHGPLQDDASELEIARKSLAHDLVRLLASSSERLDQGETTMLCDLLGDPWLAVALRICSGGDRQAILDEFTSPNAETQAESSSWSVLREDPQWPRIVDALRCTDQAAGTQATKNFKSATPPTDAFRLGLDLGLAALMRTDNPEGHEQDAPLLTALERAAKYIEDGDLQAGWQLQLSLRLLRSGHVPQSVQILDELEQSAPYALKSLRPWLGCLRHTGNPARLVDLKSHPFENDDGPDQPLVSRLFELCLQARHDRSAFVTRLSETIRERSGQNPAEQEAALDLASALWSTDESSTRELLDWDAEGESSFTLFDHAQKSLLLAGLAGISDENELSYRIAFAQHRPSAVSDLGVWALSKRTGDRFVRHQSILSLALRARSPELALYADPEYLSFEQEEARSAFLLECADSPELSAEQRKYVALGLFQKRSEDTFEADAIRFRTLAGALIPASVEQEATRDSDAAFDPNVQLAQLCAGVRFAQAGDFENALSCLEPLYEQLPSDLALCSTLRLVADKTGRPDLEAPCTVELARQSKSAERASALWERAGFLYQDVLEDSRLAEECFNAALALDPGRPLSFERIYLFAKRRGDRPRQVELLNARLVTAESDELRAELLWEKARYCRMLGRRGASLQAAEELLQLEPDHLPSLALAAELNLVDERWEAAAESLRQVALHHAVGEQERRSSGLYAADLFERTGRPREAVELIGQLQSLGISDLGAQQKQARALALTEDWGASYEAYKKLNESEGVVEKRLESAHLMLAIQRDHLRQPEGLRDAVRRVLRDAPTDADAIEIAIEIKLGADDARHLLRPAREQSRARLRKVPLDQSEIERLAHLSLDCGDDELELVALGTLALLGTLPAEHAERYSALGQTGADRPGQSLSEGDLASFVSYELSSAVGEFGQVLSAYLTRELEPDLEARGLSHLMRFDEFSGNPVREEITPWAAALGIDSFELYLGGQDSDSISILQGSPPTLIVGKNVDVPFSARNRARLVGLLLALKHGLGVFATQPRTVTGLWLEAAIKLCDPEFAPSSAEPPSEVSTNSSAETEPEFDLDQIVAHLKEVMTPDDLARLRAAYLAVEGADRMPRLPLELQKSGLKIAALAVGDPSIVRALPDLIPADEAERGEAVAELIEFAVSDEFISMRRKMRLS